MQWEQRGWGWKGPQEGAAQTRLALLLDKACLCSQRSIAVAHNL